MADLTAHALAELIGEMEALAAIPLRKIGLHGPVPLDEFWGMTTDALTRAAKLLASRGSAEPSNRDYGPGCELHRGDPHNLCQSCWQLEPDPRGSAEPTEDTPCYVCGECKSSLEGQDV